MKKLFAIAALLLGSTSAFAAYEQDYTYQGLVYKLDVTGTVYTATVKSIADDETYTVKTAWEIPEKFKALSTSGANATCADQTFTVVGIEADAFANNSNIKTITFAKAENITSIGAGAFVKTSITSLDLSGTKIATLEELFEPVNTKVTEIKLPATLATIQANAFEGLSVLTSIDFTACETDFTINADAFKNTMALTSIEFPEVDITLVDGSFDGSYVTTVTFNGDVDAPAGSFESDKLATINFNADIADAGNIATSAFAKVGTQALTVNYSPSAAAEGIAGFDDDAFAAAAVTTPWVTFNTTEAFAATMANWENAAPFAYGVKLVYSVPTPDPTTIAVANKEGSSSTYFYGTWYSTTKDIKIAKKQDGAGNVMVYGAYVDNVKDNVAILMDQLTLIGGNYYIPANTPVIVKSSKNAAVVYTEDATYSSVKYKSDGATSANEILVSGAAESFAKDIKDAGALLAPAKVPYFLAPIEEYGFLWSKFKDNTIVAPYGFYIYADKAAAGARLNVVWLDGSEEEATAIQTVKKANAEKGAIYNLAGQKVNAAYKGVVIKDGKKYIQK
ncbi:MAG: leucine-rich repeat protein [Prevotella sp.]|nr:leucine-rich repeat protein [Prevotella sp.]